MYDLIVIGGGPAGMAATSYALAKQLNTLCICTKLGGRAGGQFQPPKVLEDVQNDMRSAGEDLVVRLKLISTVQRDLGSNDLVTNVSKTQSAFDVATDHNGTLSARAVLLATGAQARPVGLPHEWELIGHGLGYSITTHAEAVAGQSVAVIGATMRALRGVAELTQTARHVTVIAPEAGELASRLGRSLYAHPAVEILEGYHVQALEADKQRVRSITVACGEDVRQIAVHAVFADLGLVPNSQMVRNLAQLDEEGRIVVDNQQCTDVPGLFAAGDVTSVPSEQILVAMGDGTHAAVNAYAYILEQRLQKERAVSSVQ